MYLTSRLNWYFLFLLVLYVQLPFPMDCLYADPDRKVMHGYHVEHLPTRTHFVNVYFNQFRLLSGIQFFWPLLWIWPNLFQPSQCKLYLALFWNTNMCARTRIHTYIYIVRQFPFCMLVNMWFDFKMILTGKGVIEIWCFAKSGQELYNRSHSRW